VTSSTTSTLAGEASRHLTVDRVTRLASVAFFAVLPCATVALLFVSTVQDDTVAFDFRQFYSGAGAVLRGETPYPAEDDPLTASSGAYVYPPLGAIGVIPLRALPLEAAGLLVMGLLVACALAIPFLLGVRDWRCYGLVFLWPPVLSAIQTGNPTLALTLCAALVWRFRDHAGPSSVSLGVTLAVKFLLLPLVPWLAATRRFGSALFTCAVAAGLLLLSWAAIGFRGLAGYPDLLRRLEDRVGNDAYTFHVLAADLGAPPGVARAVWLAIGLGLLAAVVLIAIRGDERSAFILAIAAALALSPIVWLHYFALLLVPVAIARPRLGVLWFVPLAMFVSPGSGHPTLFETGVTLAAAALTIALALRASPAAVRAAGPGAARSEPTPVRAGVSAA
jgi:hypothetical protein